MAAQSDFLRYTSPNEQRTVSREDGGFYHAIIVGAVYEFVDVFDVYTPASFFHALNLCILEHPYLSVVVSDMHTEKAFFQRIHNIDLENHIIVTDQSSTAGTLESIQEVMVTNVDTPFRRDIPLWKIVVRPLQRGCFIAFAFSHMIGDGITGVAFHRTFLSAQSRYKNERQQASQLVAVPVRRLPDPFDTTQRLPISWSFLLAPLMGHLLPSFISNLFGLKASATGADKGTWTGSKVFFDLERSRSNLKVREVKALLMENVLRALRKNDAKLTGAFLHIIARALSAAIPDSNTTNFVSQTAINMRGSIGISNEEGGMFASGCYIKHPRQNASDSFSKDDWVAIRSSTRKLAESASTLQDQAIGLLRYVSSMRKYTFDKLGKERDCSFEMSNIGAFEANNNGRSSNEAQAYITRMAFAQPGLVLGAPLAFELVSVKGGSLLYTVSWRTGALGIAEDNEESFVEAICLSIEKDLAALA